MKTKHMIVTALCITLGVVLPLTLHAVPNAGSVFLPMHIPVLLCGLLCGPACGLVGGLLTPVLSALLTGMPPASVLPGMVCELAVYGLAAGLLLSVIRVRKPAAGLYLSLILSMLAGRLVAGVANALIFQAGRYSFSMWITASFVKSLPGIAIQIVLIPALVLGLKQAALLGKDSGLYSANK